MFIAITALRHLGILYQGSSRRSRHLLFHRPATHQPFSNLFRIIINNEFNIFLRTYLIFFMYISHEIYCNTKPATYEPNLTPYLR